MVQRAGPSGDEFIAVFGLFVVSGCVSAIIPIFRDIFLSFGAVPPPLTRLVLAARPLCLILFAVACPAIVLLTAEYFGVDGGHAGELREKSLSILRNVSGAHAVRTMNFLIGGVLVGSATLLVTAVYALLILPMHVLTTMPDPRLRTDASASSQATSNRYTRSKTSAPAAHAGK